MRQELLDESFSIELTFFRETIRNLGHWHGHYKRTEDDEELEHGAPHSLFRM
jgi:hypothetical protein